MKPVLKDAFIDGWIAQGLAQGRAQGRVDMLLMFMEMRFNVPDDIRKRVEGCNEREQIMTWLRRVPTAASLDEVFA